MYSSKKIYSLPTTIHDKKTMYVNNDGEKKKTNLENQTKDEIKEKKIT